MDRMQVHAAAAAHLSAEEPPVAAETAAIPAADIPAAAPAEIAEDIRAVAEVLAVEEAVADIPAEEAARPAAVGAVEDIPAAVAVVAEVPT